MGKTNRQLSRHMRDLYPYESCCGACGRFERDTEYMFTLTPDFQNKYYHQSHVEEYRYYCYDCMMHRNINYEPVMIFREKYLIR